MDLLLSLQDEMKHLCTFCYYCLLWAGEECIYVFGLQLLKEKRLEFLNIIYRLCTISLIPQMTSL